MAKILLIEDEKAMSDLIAIKFKVEGFEVEQAFSLTEAKAKFAAGPYDAMLTDFLLPDGDLLDFLTGMRTDPNFAHLPVVVMSNYVEDINMDKIQQLGVIEVIVKYQVVPAQMVDKIKQILSKPSPQPPQAPAA